MAAVDRARNPAENLISINSPNENSSSFVPDSRRSPLHKVKEEPITEIEDKKEENDVAIKLFDDIQLIVDSVHTREKVISGHLQTIATLQLEMMSLKKKVATLTHQNNLYHLTLSTCEFCTLSGAPFETPRSTPPTDPQSEPKEEKQLSIQNSEKQAHSDKFISKMVSCVDKLACKYSPSFAKPKRRNKRPSIVPKVFASIWRLLLAPQRLINVPEPYPTVDWTQVRFKPSLPDPKHHPICSASQNPEVYKIKPDGWGQSSTFTNPEPFGTLPGYRTTEGVVSVPSQPQSGYVYCPVQNIWLISASPSRRTARGREPGGCRGKRKKEEMLR